MFVIFCVIVALVAFYLGAKNERENFTIQDINDIYERISTQITDPEFINQSLNIVDSNITRFADVLKTNNKFFNVSKAYKDRIMKSLLRIGDEILKPLDGPGPVPAISCTTTDKSWNALSAPSEGSINRPCLGGMGNQKAFCTNGKWEVAGCQLKPGIEKDLAKNGYYPGNDIQLLNTTIEECATKCRNHPTCTNIAYSNQGNSCFMKYNDTKARDTNFVQSNEWTTFPMLDNNKYKLIEKLDFPGNDITNLQNSTVEECSVKCNSTKGCIGFNFNGGTGAGAKGNCWIKNGLPNPTKTNDWNFYKKN
jgi:hypothetical protein